MFVTFIVAGVIAAILIVSVLWVTKKAYSRKWDE